MDLEQICNRVECLFIFRAAAIYFARPRLRIFNGRFYVDSGTAETVAELAMRLFQRFVIDQNRRVITTHP